MNNRPSRAVTHLVTGLGLGGAEVMLARVSGALHTQGWEQQVISLRRSGTMAARIEAQGVPCSSLELEGLGALPAAIRRLWLSVSSHPQDMLQGWMYHANLAASLVRSAGGVRRPVLWNIRQSLHDVANERPGTMAAIRLGAAMSSRADVILYNARTSARQHEAIGYDARRTRVIPNGFDSVDEATIAGAREAMRQQLRVDTDATVIGLLARWHPVKNHLGFLRAMLPILRANARCIAVLAGPGVASVDNGLQREAEAAGVWTQVRLLDAVEEPTRLLSALDVLCSASRAEGFPNVVGEAMACGLPCVVTDVGDSAWLIGDTGIVTPVDEASISEGIAAMLRAPARERMARGRAARQRVRESFSLSAVNTAYAAIYEEVAAAWSVGSTR
jgi:glycosyltransferase involved in cell wall biosynthesis